MDSIEKIIAAYDRQGIHRTGTEVDRASADGLAGEIAERGLEPALVPFPLDRVDVISAHAAIDGKTYEGLPRFDGGVTGADGIAGRLGPLGSDAEIGLVATGARSQPFVEEAREAGHHKAILQITATERVGLTPINADRFTAPFGPPVLQLSNADQTALEEDATAGEEATVVVDIGRSPCEAVNVETRLSGCDPSLAPLVIMTPRSGWWSCASERGGGLVLFLEMMRALKDAGPARDVIFTANSGHELGHLGLDHFLEENAALVTEAHCWIHLGANFAAAISPRVRLQASDDALFDQARGVLRAVGLAPDWETPVGERPGGEARNIYDGGGRYISLLGGNGLFHHPDDRWPDAIDAEKTARLAEAFSALAVSLANETG